MWTLMCNPCHYIPGSKVERERERVMKVAIGEREKLLINSLSFSSSILCNQIAKDRKGKTHFHIWQHSKKRKVIPKKGKESKS